jgi:putative phosphoribosyl transferase
MKPSLPFDDRSQAGRLLAEELDPYKSNDKVLVLGLARGGVPVAFEVAKALRAPLDVLVVRRLAVPGHPELAMGAIAVDGTRVLDDEVIQCLGISAEAVEAVSRREEKELERREGLYRAGRPLLNLHGRTAILVDDGLATGYSMLAAIRFSKQLLPQRTVLAVPVASITAIEKLRPEVDECVCLAAPEFFYTVALWYQNFPQTTDEVVKDLLEQNSRQHAPAAIARQVPSTTAG